MGSPDGRSRRKVQTINRKIKNDMTKIKGLLIDPFKHTVTEVEREKGLFEIYRLTQCSIVEAAYLKNGDAIYIDEEGTFEGHCENEEGIKKAFQIKGMQPLFGYGLVTGTTLDGDDCNCKSTLAEIEAITKFYFAR